jgi:general secretion pathway protein J
MLRRTAHRRHHTQGFTLVEVMVALLVMAIMASMAWQGVDGIVRARNASQARLEQTLRLNTVLAQWSQDLSEVQETASTPALQFDGATLRLTRRAAGGMQVVAWSLRTGANGVGSLQRWAGPATTGAGDLQESWLRTQQFLGNEAGQLQTIAGLNQWQLYFFRGNAWSNAQSSADIVGGAASAAVRETMPSGVRMVLGFAPGSGQSGSLTRDIALGPMQP